MKFPYISSLANRNLTTADLVLFSNNNLNLPTTGTVEQVLKSVIIPAGLLTSGEYVAVDFDIAIRGAANGNAKTYNVRVGGIAGTAIATTAGDTTSADRHSVSGRMYAESTNDLYGTVSNCQRTGSSFIFVNAAIAGLDLNAGTTLDVCATTATAAGDLILTSMRVALIARVI